MNPLFTNLTTMMFKNLADKSANFQEAMSATSKLEVFIEKFDETIPRKEAEPIKTEYEKLSQEAAKAKGFTENVQVAKKKENKYKVINGEKVNTENRYRVNITRINDDIMCYGAVGKNTKFAMPIHSMEELIPMMQAILGEAIYKVSLYTTEHDIARCFSELSNCNRQVDIKLENDFRAECEFKTLYERYESKNFKHYDELDLPGSKQEEPDSKGISSADDKMIEQVKAEYKEVKQEVHQEIDEALSVDEQVLNCMMKTGYNRQMIKNVITQLSTCACVIEPLDVDYDSVIDQDIASKYQEAGGNIDSLIGVCSLEELNTIIENA